MSLAEHAEDGFPLKTAGMTNLVERFMGSIPCANILNH
jgi:hypothetical protein